MSQLTGLEDAARAKLERVDHAVARLDAGTYGICISCGKPIAADCLEPRPFAERCVHAKTRALGPGGGRLRSALLRPLEVGPIPFALCRGFIGSL